MVLDVVIIGGGIAGLMTAIGMAKNGHKIHVFERKAEYVVEGGAGISLQPNGEKVLDKWNLGTLMKSIAQESGGFNMLRYENGELIARNETPGDGKQLYFLRTDFRTLLLQQARAAGVLVSYGKGAVDFDPDIPSVTLSDGAVVKADLVIAADGIKSVIRQKLFPSSVIEQRADCTCCFTVPFSKFREHKSLKHMVDDPSVQLWFGPETCIVLSPVPSQQCVDLQFVMFNYKLEDDPHPDVWNKWYDGVEAIQQRYSTYEQRVQDMLSMTDGYWKWRNCQTGKLPAWGSKNGKTLLLGEAAHAIVPFAAQGAGMCIEDAAVVSELYKGASSNSDLPRLAKLYENLRRPRMEKIASLANYNRAFFGFADGPEQEQRDRIWRTMSQQKVAGNIEPNPEAPLQSSEFRKWADDYDAIAEAQQALRPAN